MTTDAIKEGRTIALRGLHHLAALLFACIAGAQPVGAADVRWYPRAEFIVPGIGEGQVVMQSVPQGFATKEDCDAVLPGFDATALESVKGLMAREGMTTGTRFGLAPATCGQDVPEILQDLQGQPT